MRTCVVDSCAGLDRPGQAPGGRITASVWGAAAGLGAALFECGRPSQNQPRVKAVVEPVVVGGMGHRLAPQAVGCGGLGGG